MRASKRTFQSDAAARRRSEDGESGRRRGAWFTRSRGDEQDQRANGQRPSYRKSYRRRRRELLGLVAAILAGWRARIGVDDAALTQRLLIQVVGP